MALHRQELEKLSNKELLALKRENEFAFARYKNLEKTKKVQLNSCYGALGNPYFRLFDERLAESVTLSGQFAIKWIDVEINKFLNKAFKTDKEDYVVFAHTDSMYIRLDRVVDIFFPDPKNRPVEQVVQRLIDVSEKKLKPKIKEIFTELCTYFNGMENRMNMKIEIIADKGIWDGKNRYILNVYYDEGIIKTHPSLKMVGIETVKSNIPAICRAKMKRAFEIIMREDVKALREFINAFQDEFMELPIDDIAVPTGIKGMEGYTPPPGQEDKIWVSKPGISKKTGLERSSGCSRHIKAALIYNYHLREKDLTDKYTKITNNDKIKYVTLLPSNPLGQDVVAYKEVIPPEFQVEEFIDREAMFRTSFLNPVEKIAQRRCWILKEVVTISSIFGWDK